MRIEKYPNKKYSVISNIPSHYNISGTLFLTHGYKFSKDVPNCSSCHQQFHVETGFFLQQWDSSIKAHRNLCDNCFRDRFPQLSKKIHLMEVTGMYEIIRLP